MSNNKKFFNENENRDFNKLVDFNDKYLHAQITRNGEGASIDAYGVLSDGRDAAIELKNRYKYNLEIDENGNYYCIKENSSYKCNTIFCEANKMSELLLEYQYNNKREPLYINFTKNDYVLVFNLNKLLIKPDYEIYYVRNEGYNFTEKCYRYLLNITDATIYKKENDSYTLIQTSAYKKSVNNSTKPLN
jgi:hypothetical protein